MVSLEYCGTAKYMAPEIKELKPEVGDGDEFKSALINPWLADIYSFGITMLSLLNPNVKKVSNLLKILRNNKDDKND